MLFLSNEEIESILTMEDTLEVLENALGDLAEGNALWRPRSDMTFPKPDADERYKLKSMDGMVPRYKIASVRINSDVSTYPIVDGVRRQVKKPVAKGKYFVGFIILFDTDTGEPLAMIPDGVVQQMRVGATGGLGAKYLARENSSRLGLIGSGQQAVTQVLAMCAVRPIKEVTVYSPTKQNREAFAKKMNLRLPDVNVTAVDSFDAAIAGADIVTLATNARDPIIDWSSIEPGMHVTAVHWQNLDTSIFKKADVVVSNARPAGRWEPGPDDYIYIHDYVMGKEDTYRGGSNLDPNSPDFINWYDYNGIGEMVAGKGPKRLSEDQVTLHANNVGIALQFAAVGALVVNKAKEKGLGREVPTEWLLQTIHP